MLIRRRVAARRSPSGYQKARIRAALRRQTEPEPYRLGGLAIHYEERRVSVAGLR